MSPADLLKRKMPRLIDIHNILRFRLAICPNHDLFSALAGQIHSEPHDTFDVATGTTLKSSQ